MTRLFLSLCLGLIGVAGLPALAHAQYNPYNPYVNPYYPRGYQSGPGYNAGAYLSGSAQVMQSYGDVIVKQEDARIQREKANQAKLDTKKQAFDQMLYEKANTPTYVEDLSREKQNLLVRVMNFPVRGEIVNGYSLNTMLPLMQSFSLQGTMGPPVPLAQSIVNQLNITGAGSGGDNSVGMLRDGGRVDWPLGLQGKNQQALDKLLPQAYSAAGMGKLTPKLMKDIRTEMKTMRDAIRVQCQKDEIDTSTYMQAIEFYNSLDSSITALERPDARKQLSGAYSPRARNVQELVDFMTDNGLKFAPATPGNENAYQVAHDSFVRYARTAQGSSGFQAMNSTAMPIPAPKK